MLFQTARKDTGPAIFVLQKDLKDKCAPRVSACQDVLAETETQRQKPMPQQLPLMIELVM
jgi:hypothetical protein